MSSTLEEGYSKTLNALGMDPNKDPFPIIPPEEVDYWADNKTVLKKLVETQVDSLLFSSSFIYILYGPVGGGKTFAVKYLANPEIQKMLLKRQRREPQILSILVKAIMPIRTGELTFSLHKSIVKACFSEISKRSELIEIFRKTKDLGVGKTRLAFENIIKKSITSDVANGTIGIRRIEDTEGYKLLTQQRSRLGKLQDIDELVETIQVLINILTLRFNRIFISIDELENLRSAKATERFLCSDFLRKMYEMNDNHVSFFLIFTRDSFEEVEALLQRAFLSRVKNTIQFPFVDKSDVKDYIVQCIAQRQKIDPYSVLDERVLDEISNRLFGNLKGKLSFRQINQEMHNMFTKTYIIKGEPEHYIIDYNLYQEWINSANPEETVGQVAKAPAENSDES